MIPTGEAIDGLLRKLSRLALLDARDHDVVRGWELTEENVAKGRTVPAVQGYPFIVSGLAASYRMTLDGKLRITALHFPGDLLGSAQMFASEGGGDILAVTAVRLAIVPHHHIETAFEHRPALRLALWNNLLWEAAITREWLLSVGFNNAKARIARFLSEYAWRAADAQGSSLHRFTCPLTQDQLGAALGLTAVHVNRTLRAMTLSGLIRFGQGQVHIFDVEGLRRLGEFTPPPGEPVLHQGSRGR